MQEVYLKPIPEMVLELFQRLTLQLFQEPLQKYCHVLFIESLQWSNSVTPIIFTIHLQNDSLDIFTFWCATAQRWWQMSTSFVCTDFFFFFYIPAHSINNCYNLCILSASSLCFCICILYFFVYLNIELQPCPIKTIMW